MTAVDLSDGLAAALEYGASHGWRVFPAIPGSKKPYIDDWPNAATTDSVTLFGWWGRWPNALVAAVTGEAFVALDADIKANEPTGFDTLGELGWPFWFETRTVHTPSGGCHAHFQVPSPNIHNTVGKRGRGIGLNLDWRGDGGYVIVPGAGDYRWDPHLGLDTPLAEVPAARFEAYLQTERRAGERYVADTGRVEWLASFAPIAPAELRAFTRGISSPAEADDDLVGELAHGLTLALSAYAEMGFESFNLAIYGAPSEIDGYPLNLRLACRSNLKALYRSDSTFLERLHWEGAIDLPPEMVAERVRGRFRP